MEDTLVWLSAFFGCAVGSVIPIIHTELLIFGIALLLPGSVGIPLVLVATLGTMVGKTALYYGGRGLLRLPFRGRDRLDRFMADVERQRSLAGGLLFASAALGVPPFYMVSVASGAIRLPLPRFLVLGFLGRLLRFTAVVYAPHLIRGLVS